MPKGFNTQVVAILLQNPVTLEQVREVLWDFGKSDDHSGTDDPAAWAIGSRGFNIFYDGPKKEGAVILDIIDRPWPDDMGDMQTSPMVMMAWTMGQFGPGAFPGSLERACQQSWSWPDAQETVQKHAAFIRLRLTYMTGEQDENAPLLPEGYDASDSQHELAFLDDIAKSLLDLPGALCYFNPSGEVVMPPQVLVERSAAAQDANLPNLSAWANIRLFRASDQWSLMDSVGNAQFETPDMEILVSNGNDEALNDYDGFIRNLTWYLMQNPGAIKDGHTADGPGGQLLRAQFFSNPLIVPPRDVILWLPDGMDTLPEGFPERETTPDEPEGEDDSDQYEDDQDEQSERKQQ
jgi:hypothetical protein